MERSAPTETDTISSVRARDMGALATLGSSDSQKEKKTLGCLELIGAHSKKQS
jgi:hypothetical protein